MSIHYKFHKEVYCARYANFIISLRLGGGRGAHTFPRKLTERCAHTKFDAIIKCDI